MTSKRTQLKKTPIYIFFLKQQIPQNFKKIPFPVTDVVTLAFPLYHYQNIHGFLHLLNIIYYNF